VIRPRALHRRAEERLARSVHLTVLAHLGRAHTRTCAALRRKCPLIRGSTTGVSASPPVGTCGMPSLSRESAPAARRARHPSTPLGACGPRTPGSARWAHRGDRRSACPRLEEPVVAGPTVDAKRMSARKVRRAAVDQRARDALPVALCHSGRAAALRVILAGMATNRHFTSAFRSPRTWQAGIAARQRRYEPWSHFTRYIRRLQGRTRAKHCR
jgi:hypothetical protein